MQVELEYCQRGHNGVVDTVEFGYLIGAGEATVRITYEKCYGVDRGYPESWAGLNEWSIAITAGADFNVGACSAAKWAQFIALVTLFHEEQGHPEWVVSGRTE